MGNTRDTKLRIDPISQIIVFHYAKKPVQIVPNARSAVLRALLNIRRPIAHEATCFRASYVFAQHFMWEGRKRRGNGINIICVSLRVSAT